MVSRGKREGGGQDNLVDLGHSRSMVGTGIKMQPRLIEWQGW